MIRTPAENWWLLIACGVLEASIAAIYLVMARTDGPVVSHTWGGTVVLAGKLTMAVGACTIAAALWGARDGRSWPLVLNGVVLSALGFVQYALTRFPISILTIALLVAAAAITIGMLQAGIARTAWQEHRSGDAWMFGAGGVGSAVFALVSLAFGLRVVPLAAESHLDLVWLGLYFAFAAVCTVALGLRMHWRDPVS